MADTGMRGKICLVTGGTAGIGAATARGLAQREATVVIIGRNEQLGVARVRQLKEETGNSAVELMLADLSSQQEIRRLAREFTERYSRLDVLVNNAGALFMSRRQSVDGIEMTFALNHLSYFLLTNLLLDMLEACAPARIVNVASDAHEGATIDVAALQGTVGLFGMKAYGQSKLANVLFTYELARRLAGTGVTVNTLHPGVVGSGFGMNNGWLAALGMRLIHRFSLSPEEGAETSIYLATSPEVAGVTGKYFVKKSPVPSSKATYDVDVARRLWELSEQLTGLTSPAM